MARATTSRRGWRAAAAVSLATSAFAVAAGGAPPAAADGNEAPGAPLAARSLSAGQSSTCAIVADGTVRCWGLNQDGQLGAGDTEDQGDETDEMGAHLTSVPLGAGRTATSLSTWASHVCAVLDNATLKCWGSNGSGRLGQGDTADRGDQANELGDNLPIVNLGTGRTATAVSAGGNHTCAVLDNAGIKCWGLNTSGQLGLGNTTNVGDNPLEMGNNLPAVNLGTGRTATVVATGNSYSCAILDNGNVKCWGFNGSGQLGLGDTNSRGDGASEMGGNLPVVALGTGRTAVAITAGNGHTCALLDNASVKCWGENFDGQLGLGDTNHRGDGAGEMGNSLPSVNLGAGRTAIAISAGNSHTCALLDNDRVKCWGSGADGRLGQGDTTDRGDGAGEMGANLPTIELGTGRTAEAVATGSDHTCVTLDNGSRKCWGDGEFGALGQGSTTTRGDQANEMGDDLDPIFLPPAGLVAGIVRDSSTSGTIVGAQVAALRTGDFSLAGGAVANGNGFYSLNLPTGTYFLYLIDPAVRHTEGFFGPPTVVTVTNGSSQQLSPTMTSTGGGFSGLVTDDATGQPLAGVWVLAIGPSGLAGSTVVDCCGTYAISGLPPGSYRASFIDASGVRSLEYWNDSPDFEGATVFNVTAGGNTTGINAALDRP